jgi:hypothetical protein
MNRETAVLVILLAIFKMNCLGQINDFKDILAHPIKNKNIIKSNNDIHSERTFLGLIKDSKGKAVFYVAKEFYTVQVALVRHGHTRIVFFDNQKKMIACYYLGLPEDLPYKLVSNSLFFKYRADRTGKDNTESED